MKYRYILIFIAVIACMEMAFIIGVYQGIYNAPKPYPFSEQRLVQRICDSSRLTGNKDSATTCAYLQSYYQMHYTCDDIQGCTVNVTIKEN